MTKPVRLDRAFKYGVSTTYLVRNGEQLVIGIDKAALIIGGTVFHVTGTDSDIRVYKRAAFAPECIFASTVVAAHGSEVVSLYSTTASVVQASYVPTILEHPNLITMVGGANSFVVFHVLEWDIK